MDQTIIPPVQPAQQSHSKVKIIISLLILALAIGGLVFWSLNMKGNSTVANEFHGRVASVSGNVIKAEGYLNVANELDKKVVTIDFAVTSKTKFVKNSLMLRNDLPDGEGYTPETRVSVGTLSDLRKGIIINKVTGGGSMLGKTSVSADQIEYSVMVQPTGIPGSIAQ